MSDELIPAVVLWWDSQKLKGMAKDADGNVYAFDSRNLSEQLQETGVFETHLVSLELNYRNGHGLAKTVHCPTREEAAEWGDTLRDVYERNQIEVALRKVERRSAGFYNALR